MNGFRSFFESALVLGSLPIIAEDRAVLKNAHQIVFGKGVEQQTGKTSKVFRRAYEHTQIPAQLLEVFQVSLACLSKRALRLKL